MKNILLVLFLNLSVISTNAQSKKSFDTGEWFKFKMSYSGFLKAGNATLEIKEDVIQGNPVYHVVGKGWTTGAIRWFFRVDDRYESYFDKKTGLPYRFIRKIDEGGHTKDLDVTFDHARRKATVVDKKNKTTSIYTTEKNVQDMVSAYYYLRNNYDTNSIKEGDVLSLYMFFDEENYNFKLKYLGTETIETSFGKIKTLMFRPYVMAGRVFKEQESLTLWVSADDNKIPLRIKADLRVGSLRADLESFKGLSNSFKLQID